MNLYVWLIFCAKIQISKKIIYFSSGKLDNFLAFVEFKKFLRKAIDKIHVGAKHLKFL